MPLFKATVTIEMKIVVVAKDDDDAWEVAASDWKECFQDSDPKPSIYVDGAVNALSDLPKDWDGICIPYGGDGDTRIAEILGR